MSDSVTMPSRATVQQSCLFWLLLSSFQLAARAPAQSPKLLLDINKKLMPNVSSRPHSFLRVGNKTFFVATGLGVGEELWITDGTSLGTRLVKDIAPGQLGSRPSSLTALGQTLFFIANDWKTGKELWKSDGTRQGTVIVKDIGRGLVGGRVKNMRVLGQELLFQALDIPPFTMLWKTDGTKQGTQKLIGPNLTPPYRASEFVVAGANLFFQGDGLLWRSNGTQAGTGIIPGPTVPWKLSSFGKLLVFFSYTANNLSIWTSDGTRFGTRKIKDLPAGAAPAGEHAVPNRFLFFFLLQLASKTELWRSDGSSNGTFAIASFGPKLSARNFVELGNSVLFQIGNEIWASDGSSNGTRRRTASH